MSFIEKAIHKAKETTTASIGDGLDSSKKSSTVRPVNCGLADTNGEFCYTITKSIPIDADTLIMNRLIANNSNTIINEAYKHLRTQILQKTLEEHRNVLMLISPLPDEGKTLTTINLAISISQELDQTVLLVDADLRSPSIHRYFGLPNTMGLVDYLEGRVTISDLLVHPEGFDRLVILPGGKPAEWAPELIRSPQMTSLMKELKFFYADRYVLVDLPPLLSYADGLAFAPMVDGIVVIVEAQKTPQDDLLRCKEMLENFPVLGYVFNKVDNFDTKRYYNSNGHPGKGWFASLKHLIFKKQP